MAGFDNEVCYGKNADFTSVDNQNVLEANGLATNGQMWIGTTAVNAGGTHINVGALTSPNSSITFGYSSPNITAVVNTSVVTDLHTARLIVGDLANGANYTTITAALAAAVTGNTIYLQEGQYTENLTLKNGVNIAGMNRNGGAGMRTSIIGKLIDGGGAVSCSLTNLSLQTNGDFCIQLTGSGTVSLSNVRADGTNNTIFSLAGTANLRAITCYFALGTTGIALYANASSGSFYFQDCEGANTGASTTASSSTGNVTLVGCNFQLPLVTSGAGTFSIENSINDTSAINTAALTTAGTGITSIVTNSILKSGTASAISIGANTLVAVYKSVIDSTNTNPVTGAGTYRSDETTYSNSGILPNPTTETFAIVGRNGTFTPLLQFAAAAVGMTYTTQVGTYTRIGNVVTFTINIVLSAKGSSTGTAAVAGLPFASAGITTCVLNASLLTFTGQVAGRIGTGGSQVNLDSFATTGARAQLTDTAFVDTTTLQISGSYLV